VVVSAPPGEGLTTTFTQVVLTADRLLRDFVILEDAGAPIKDIQNVKPFRWGGPEKLAPLAVLETAMRGYPTAVVVPDLRDKALAAELARLAGELLVIVGVQASDAVQAIEKMLALGMPPDGLATSLRAATCQRLIRRLCPKCSEGYQPAAELLAKLRLPAVEALTFKKATALGCPACSGTGHLGRGAIFELAAGPTVAKAVAAKVDRSTLVKAAVRDGMQRFTEAGIAMVVAGTTSLDELQRVLKKG
jgi:type II secretory ATPase GspE/PulE/Tfp pilus assembly ATPase PilB-like protein